MNGRVLAPDYNPITIAQCNLGQGDVEVNHWTTTKFGKISLFCGSSKSGYVHIRDRHQGDWQKLLDKYGVTGKNWDDLMDYATQGNLVKPIGGYPIDLGSNKWCYSGKLDVADDNGRVVANYRPVTIVSANNKLVITTYPSSNSDCSGA